MAQGDGRSADAQRCRRRRLALTVAACLAAGTAPPVAAFGEAPKFLIASSPSTSTIAYVRLPDGYLRTTEGPAMRILLNGELQFPQGIAVDEFRRMLYVADPSLGRLVRYPLKSSGNDLKVGKEETVALGVEVRAVAVDGVGNVWFTDEPNQRIMRITAKDIEEGHTVPEIVYDGAKTEEVRAPGGIAVDNFHVYWLNKANGKKTGSLIRALQNPPAAIVLEGNMSTDPNPAERSVHALAKNSDKCYGICLALGNAFYSDEFSQLYGVSRSAVALSKAVSVSTALSEPRGCIYDGDSTVYVADKAGSAIWSLAANMEELLPGRELVKAAELQGAFGVAVFTDLEGDMVE